MTNEDYKIKRAQLDANETASRAWMKENKTNGIPVEVSKTFPFADVVNNDLRSAIEVHEFINERPKKYFLYICEKSNEANTWTGEKLGYVLFGRQYRDNFGGVRIPISVNAINGVKYHGTYFKSSGDYARITANKNQ